VSLYMDIQLYVYNQHLAIHVSVMDEINDITHFEGYFKVIVPPNLLKLLGGDIFKLKESVSKYNTFLKQYGKCVEDVLNYTEISYLMAVGKDPAELVVKIETESQAVWCDLLSGIESEDLKIFLKGTAIVEKDDVDNVDQNVVDIKIKKVEAFWKGRLHSSSPTSDQPLKKAVVDLFTIFNPENTRRILNKDFDDGNSGWKPFESDILDEDIPF
jgi:hypothetical protein